MNTELLQKYRTTRTEDLIKIAFIDKVNYEAEAVEMATKELLSRGITSQSEIVLGKSQEQTKEFRIRDTALLETKSKVIFFICGPVPLLFAIAVFFILLQKEKRGMRKTKESWKWLLFGFGSFYTLLLLLAFIRWNL